MDFIDRVRLFLSGGDGGSGCMSFRREKYIPFGGPDGGDGGKGGDVFLEASSSLSTFLDLARRPHRKGEDGGNGKGSDKTGESGADCVVLVPLGTVVFKDGLCQADLCEEGGRFLAAKGGRGGRGNLSFKTQRHTAPRIAEKGEPGERATIHLELKLLADVGLVGLPNAGKSSLLARISKARPKIADYPFTTLQPHLGVVSHKEESFVAADIPGLIEGAHDGTGLGDGFLRHIERTRLLWHLIDPLGFGGLGPREGVRLIEAELAAFSPGLARKPKILVVNKMDLPEGKAVLGALKRLYRRRRVIGVSAATGEGVAALLDEALKALSELPKPGPFPAAPVLTPGSVRVEQGFSIERQKDGRFALRGNLVEKMAAMLRPELPEAVSRFQNTLRKMGVDKALRRLGAAEGDVVRCGAVEFEWRDEGAETDRDRWQRKAKESHAGL